MKFTDRLTLDGDLRRTGDGYAVASVRVARGGNVQEYLGIEMGIADKDVVRVYRPEDEVFKRDAMRSYAGAPVTVGHPSSRVTADSWKEHAVGETGDEVLREGEFVRVPLMLRDSAAISEVETGTRELSMGYDAMVTMEDGVTPDGEAYDAIMSDFKMNHVAIVDQARGGKELRIGDKADAGPWGASPLINHADTKGTRSMTDKLRTVLVDGLSVETTDAGAQAIDKLQKDAQAIQTKLTDAETAHTQAIEAKDAELAQKDAQIDDLKGKVLDEAALDAKVAERADLITKAKAIAPDIKTDGVKDADIRKAAVVTKMGDEAVKDKSQAYIDARFDILAEDIGSDDKLRDSITHIQPSHDAAGKAQASYVDRMTGRAKA